MAEPLRTTIVNAIRTRLLGITAADGFKTDVVRVEINYKSPDTFRKSDFPLIMILPQVESARYETEGDQVNGRYHRAWSFEIVGILWPDGDQDEIFLAGLQFTQDIERRLTAAKDFDISAAVLAGGFSLGDTTPPTSFEVESFKAAFVKVDVVFNWAFKPSSL